MQRLGAMRHAPGDGAIAYRVYSAPKGVDDFSLIARRRTLFKQFETFDDALAWARNVDQAGDVPLIIDGDDGTYVDRVELAAMLRTGLDQPALRTGFDEPAPRTVVDEPVLTHAAEPVS